MILLRLSVAPPLLPRGVILLRHESAQLPALPFFAPPLQHAVALPLRLCVAPLPLQPLSVLLQRADALPPLLPGGAPLLPQVSVALPQLAGALLLLPHAAVPVLLQSDAVLQPDVVPTASVACLFHLFLERSPES